MRYRYLGNTGILVSELCFGSLTLGPLQAGLSLDEGASLLRYAFEQGINFIDTAKLYDNYAYIARALRDWDKPVVIASKSYDYTAEGMKKSLEEARIALNRDYVDIFMLHEQESELTLQGHKPALDWLGEAKTRGLVKAVGISTHTVSGVKAALKHDAIEVIHPIVNMRGLGILDGTLHEMNEALEQAYNQGKGIYGMKALGGGNLIPHAADALTYAFSHPYLHSVAVGCRIKEEIDFNLYVFEQKQPPEGLVNQLKKVPRTLYVEEWCEGCGACLERCPFGLLELKEGKAALNAEGCLLCGYCAAVCPQFAIKVL